MVYKSWGALTKQIQKRIDDSLKVEVAKTVKEAEERNIKEYVYKAYEPSVYERRSSGGLSDIGNMKSKLIETGVLQVTNETPPNPYARDGATTNKNLSELVEYGYGYKGYQYDYPTDWEYMFPRPFTQKTNEELERTKEHVSALKKGLVRNNLKVD